MITFRLDETDVSDKDTFLQLKLIGARMNAASALWVQEVTTVGHHKLKQLTPRGETGNLQNSIFKWGAPVPSRSVTTGRFTAGGDWQQKFGFLNPAELQDWRIRSFSSHKREVQDGSEGHFYDPPWAYLGAIERGRKAMSKPPGKKFAWYDKSLPPATRGKGDDKVPYGKYNVFRQSLKAREGTHMMRDTIIFTEAYAEANLDKFTSWASRSTARTRNIRREELGINPLDMPGLAGNVTRFQP